MLLEDYKRFCFGCDSILYSCLANDPEFVAINSLHVLNAHPSNSECLSLSRSNSFILLLIFLCHSIHSILRSFLSFPFSLSTYYDLDVDVVVISHLLSPEHLKADTDFYFGDLSNALTASGKRTLSVLFNHTGRQPSQLWSDPNANVISRVPVVRSLTPLDELCIFWTQCRLSLRMLLSPDVRIQNIPNSAFYPLSRATSANLRFYKQILFLFRKLKPSTIILTYEGHAWERLSFYAARMANPNVLCVGYQHAVIFPMQHSIKRSLGPMYDPDTILFSGEYGRLWFLNNADFSPLLSVVGTPRSEKPVTSVFSSPKLELSNPSCLLLPDGTISESLAIFRFGLLCASKLSDIRFVIRLHPLLSIGKLFSEDASLRDMPPNFLVSRQSIHSDFTDNLWAIYRGSGSGVRAAASGLRPIYYNISSMEMSIDPLHSLSLWRREAQTVDDIASILRSDLSTSPSRIDEEFRAVGKQLGAFFGPFNLSAFLRQV